MAKPAQAKRAEATLTGEGGDIVAIGNGSLEILTFSLGDELFAIEARHVREILDLVTVTEVPSARAFVKGLINVRGKVVPLADIRLPLGLGFSPPTIDTRIIVLEVDIEGDQTTVGILADKVFEVTEIIARDLEATPRIGMRWRQEAISCIGKRAGGFVIILNLGWLFSAASGLDAGGGAIGLAMVNPVESERGLR